MSVQAPDYTNMTDDQLREIAADDVEAAWELFKRHNEIAPTAALIIEEMLPDEPTQPIPTIGPELLED